jgi:1-acyl-sn-glycerol-3-phosphate acyltransferase
MKMANVSALTHEITLEILAAFGLPKSKWAEMTIGSFFKKPAMKFSQMMATIDQNLAQYGYREAARNLLPMFVDSATASGVENIPKEGPLLIASNHPGTIDGAAISANIPRDDLKVFAGPIPFLDNLPNLRDFLIFSSTNTNARATALRRSIQHLENNGALLIFPAGQIDPDPEVLPGAPEALEKWSRSIALMLRKVPQTQILPTITSGVLAKTSTYTPFAVLRKDGVAKRRIMEFIQTMRQILSGKRFGLTPHVTFAPPLSIKDLENLRDADHVMRVIVDRAKQLLSQHMSNVQTLSLKESN